jgi:hypothetical protein
MKITKKKIALGLLVLVILGVGVGWYVIQQKLKPDAAYIQHCNNARLIHEQFVEFELDYLELPSAEAMADDPEAAALDLTTSNGYLGQLIIAAAMESEEIFFIAGSSCCPGDAPDNVVVPRKEVLRPGENGWAYFKGRVIEGNADPSQPLLVPGWDPKTKGWSDVVWKNGVPVLRVDGSVVLYKASDNGRAGDYETQKADLPFEKDDPDWVQPATK